MVTDAELEQLHGRLRRMDPDYSCYIGGFAYTAGQLFWIVEEALQARAWVKDGETDKPERPEDRHDFVVRIRD